MAQKPQKSTLLSTCCAAFAFLALALPSGAQEITEPAVPVEATSPASSLGTDTSDAHDATLSPEEKAKLGKVREERRKARKELLERLRNASPEEKARLRAQFSASKHGDLVPELSDSPNRQGVKRSENKEARRDQERQELRKEMRKEIRENGTLPELRQQMQQREGVE